MTDKLYLLMNAPADLLSTPLAHSFGVCERHSHGMWEEPLNVVSSLCFFIAGFLNFHYYFYNPEISQKRILDIHILTILTFCIGVASTLFHMMPNYYTELLDILFIVIFINVFFFSVMIRLVGLNWFQITICYLAFIGSTHIMISHFPNALNDSVAYLSSMGTLVFVAIYLNSKRRASARQFLLASIVGICSLFFRIIDKGVCSVLPTGSHFLWHVCNSLLVFILLRQLIRSVNRRARMLRMASEYGL
ncbi:MAG: hypothetical protein SFT90_03715 [Rickettsiales bacterium]|nr:hypothetical protein [Rickettsiales bacterium]